LSLIENIELSLLENTHWKKPLASNHKLCTDLNHAINNLTGVLRANLTETYDPVSDLGAFCSASSDKPAILDKIYTNIALAIFDIFFSSSEKTEAGTMLTEYDESHALENTAARIKLAMRSFYIAAGFFLVVLAALYWMGRRKKSREEWVALALRVVAGIGVILVILVDYLPRSNSHKFLLSPWIIPVVTLSYFLGTKKPHIGVKQTAYFCSSDSN
jgi:hypothetical protein